MSLDKLMPPDHMRMIGVLGQREMEIAAIKILDNYWDMPEHPIDQMLFKNDLEKAGWHYLQQNGWIKDNVPTRAFWLRVHGR